MVLIWSEGWTTMVLGKSGLFRSWWDSVGRAVAAWNAVAEQDDQSLLEQALDKGLEAGFAELEKQRKSNDLVDAQTEHERAAARAVDLDTESRRSTLELERARQVAELRIALANAQLAEDTALHRRLELLRALKEASDAAIGIEVIWEDNNPVLRFKRDEQSAKVIDAPREKETAKKKHTKKKRPAKKRRR